MNNVSQLRKDRVEDENQDVIAASAEAQWRLHLNAELAKERKAVLAA